MTEVIDLKLCQINLNNYSLKEEDIHCLVAIPGEIIPGVDAFPIDFLSARINLERWFDWTHREKVTKNMKEVDPDWELPQWKSHLAWGHRSRQQTIQNYIDQEEDDENLYD